MIACIPAVARRVARKRDAAIALGDPAQAMIHAGQALGRDAQAPVPQQPVAEERALPAPPRGEAVAFG